MLRDLEKITKNQLRREFLAKRSQFVSNSQSYLLPIYRSIILQLLKILSVCPSGLVATYRARPEEVNLSELPQHLSECRYAYPVVKGDHLSFFIPRGEKSWRQGSFGIWEPDQKDSTEIDLNSCQAVLIPGVAFDREGNRIGYGKGYYDRALKKNKSLKIGIGFSVQLSEELLPAGPQDISVDWVVTEDLAISIREQALK